MALRKLWCDSVTEFSQDVVQLKAFVNMMMNFWVLPHQQGIYCSFEELSTFQEIFYTVEVVRNSSYQVSCSCCRTIWFGAMREDCPYMQTLVAQLQHLKAGFITTCLPATETILLFMWKADKAALIRKSQFIETTSPRMFLRIRMSSF